MRFAYSLAFQSDRKGRATMTNRGLAKFELFTDVSGSPCRNIYEKFANEYRTIGFQ